MKNLVFGVMVVLLLSFPLVVMTGCQTNTFSKYGFSFKYPREFPIKEMGLLPGDAANDKQGIVQVGVENGEIKLFQVTYLPRTGPGVIEAFEADAFSKLKWAKGTASAAKSDRVEITTKAGNRLVYHYIYRLSPRYYYCF